MKTKAVLFLKDHKKFLLYTGLALLFLVLFSFFDKAAVLWIGNSQKTVYNSEIYQWLESVDPFINFISHGTTLIIMAFLLCVLGKMLSKRLYSLGKILFIGFLSSGIAVQFLKHLIGRARPRLTHELAVIGPSLRFGYDSFPSGHTAVVFCLAYILSQYSPEYSFFFYTFSLVVGFERIEDLSHFPSDVLAGAILGLIIGKLLLKIMTSSSPAYNRNIGETVKGDITMEEKPRFFDRNRIPLSFALVMIFMIEDIFGRVRPRDIDSLGDFWGLAGLLIVLIGVLLRSWAAGVIKKRDSLATTGPYALMRHPMYIGSFLMALGFCTILNDIDNILLVLIIIPVIYIPKIRQEELDLAKKFGKEWEGYKKRTSIFFPKRVPFELSSGSNWSLAQWARNREYQAFFTSFFALIALELYRELLF